MLRVQTDIRRDENARSNRVLQQRDELVSRLCAELCEANNRAGITKKIRELELSSSFFILFGCNMVATFPQLGLMQIKKRIQPIYDCLRFIISGATETILKQIPYFPYFILLQFLKPKFHTIV